MINTTNFEEAKYLINKQKTENKEKIIVIAQTTEFNRKILEYGKFNILLSIENSTEKSSLRQLNSGLNEILAKIALKNGISIGIDLLELKKLGKKENAIRLTKIRQNMDICKKTHTSLVLLNYHNKRNALSFLLSLDLSSKEAKKALE